MDIKKPTTPAQVSVLDFDEDEFFCSKSDNAFLSSQEQMKEISLTPKSISGEHITSFAADQSKLKNRRKSKARRK